MNGSKRHLVLALAGLAWISASVNVAAAQSCATSDRHALLPLSCANAENLQNMVADPKDLEHGRVLAPANGQRESTAVDTYEQNKIKPFDASKTTTTSIVLPGASGGTQ